MAVAEWMTRDPVVTGADTPLEESLATMIRHRVRHLPVLEDDVFVGLLSAPSLVQHLSQGSLDPTLAASPSRQHISWVKPLEIHDGIDEAIAELQNYSCLPVVDQGRLAGLFSYHNLMNYFMRHLAPQRVRRGGATPSPHRLDSLVNLVRRLGNAEDPDSILQCVLSSLRPLMPVDQAFILFSKPEDESLEVAASFRAKGAEGEYFSHIPVRDTLSGYVHLHARSLLVEDLNQEKRFPSSQDLLQKPSQVPLRSVMAVPLLDHHQSFGLLQFWCKRPYAYLESDLELLELAAGYLASMIQRGRRLDEEREANRIKDEFLAVVTHDLRNTIQGVMSYSQLLQRKAADPRMQTLAKGIVDSARHMSNLTNDLHDLARLGMQAMRVEPETCPLAAAIDQVLEEFNEFAQQQKVTLRPAEIPPELTCRADPVRLRQVLSNLVSNAIKYNREGGAVTVTARREPGSPGVSITVEDNGIGIALDEQVRVFDLFTRASNHRRRDSSGLGLAITKRLVELHGGTVELESEPERGTRFRVYFPDQAPHQEP